MRSLLSHLRAPDAAGRSYAAGRAGRGKVATCSARRWPAALALGVLLSVVMTVATAYGAVTRSLLSSFGSFGSVQGLAVDQSSGSVYVYDATEGGKVYKFDSTGKPSNFSSTGTNMIEGVGASGPSEDQIAVDSSSGVAKGDIYVANGSDVSIYGADGKSLGELNGNVSSEVSGAPWGEPCGVAVDAEGHVYVGLYGSHVNKYTPSANPAVNTDYTASLNELNGICNVAADSEGNVYADTWSSGPIDKYSALQFGALQASGATVSTEGHTLAVNLATDELYADTGSKVLVYDTAGALKEDFKPPAESASSFGGSYGVAVDDTNGGIYVSDNEHGRIDAFGPPIVVPDATTGGTELTKTSAVLKGTVNPDGVETECYFEWGYFDSYGNTAPCASSPGSGTSPVEVSAEILSGLMPGWEFHYRLVAANANGLGYGEDRTFALPYPPRVETWVQDVKLSTAKIVAHIDPMGYDTSYRIEYGTSASYGTTIPVPDAPIGGGTSEKTVSQSITGLTPGATYHFRVLATNENGATASEDQSFTTFAEPLAEQADHCPNAAYRVAASAQLPDCRAYEMVSPVEKNGADISAQSVGQFLSAESGNRVEFMTRTGMGETKGSGAGSYSQYVATRSGSGWSTNAITPTPAQNDPLQLFFGDTSVQGFSTELDRGVATGYALPGIEGAVPHAQNWYLEDTLSGKLLEPITKFEGVEDDLFFPFELAGAMMGTSIDLGVAALETPANLIPQATGSEPKVYIWNHGKIELAGLLPTGSLPAEGASGVLRANVTFARKLAVSRDGSRVLFKTPANGSSTEQLYVRKDGTATAWISQPELPGASFEPKGVYFEAATPDFKKVVFTSEDRLLDSDPGNLPEKIAGGQETGLYLYTDSPNPETESNLTFIGRVSLQCGGCNGGVLGISEDGSRVYFETEYSEFGLPESTYSHEGLFIWSNDHIRHVAPAPSAKSPGFGTGWAGSGPGEEFQMTPDGTLVAFASNHNLLGEHGNGFRMYVYDDSTGSLKCASCPQSGAALTTGLEERVSATVDASPGFSLPAKEPRFLSRNGRYIFFNTKEALLPQDTNKVVDAYEYNVETGRLSLLSAGTGETGTWFVESSPSGEDAFLATRQPLSGWDVDKLDDLYDARVNGGFPEPPPPSTPCSGDECQGSPSAVPSFGTASEFNGRGNPQWPSGGKAVKHRRATRAHRLRKMLRACRRKPPHKRALCVSRARRLYGAHKPAKRASRRSAR